MHIVQGLFMRAGFILFSLSQISGCGNNLRTGTIQGNTVIILFLSQMLLKTFWRYQAIVILINTPQSPPKFYMLHIRRVTCHTSPKNLSLDETMTVEIGDEPSSILQVSSQQSACQHTAFTNTKGPVTHSDYSHLELQPLDLSFRFE